MSRDRSIFLALAVSAVACGALAERLRVGFFARFLGPYSPTLVLACAGLAGALAMPVLGSAGRFAVWRPWDRRGPLLAAVLAVAFGIAIAAADLVIRFPADLNAPFRDSLLFYPAIAFLVEVVFHLVPLALLLLLVVRAVPPRRRDGAIAVALLLVALFEPTFQLTLGGSSQIAPWVPVFVWFHVAAFNLAQLALFRRHDLVSMLALRLAYYAIWHIGWGQLRLRVLF